jgi:hypothetical protein
MSGRRNGLAMRTREHVESRNKGKEEEREEEQEASDFGGREEEQGAEADGSQDRMDKEERLTKGNRCKTPLGPT